MGADDFAGGFEFSDDGAEGGAFLRGDIEGASDLRFAERLVVFGTEMSENSLCKMIFHSKRVGLDIAEDVFT